MQAGRTTTRRQEVSPKVARSVRTRVYAHATLSQAGGVEIAVGDAVSRPDSGG